MDFESAKTLSLQESLKMSGLYPNQKNFRKAELVKAAKEESSFEFKWRIGSTVVSSSLDQESGEILSIEKSESSIKNRSNGLVLGSIFGSLFSLAGIIFSVYELYTSSVNPYGQSNAINLTTFVILSLFYLVGMIFSFRLYRTTKGMTVAFSVWFLLSLPFSSHGLNWSFVFGLVATSISLVYLILAISSAVSNRKNR